MRQFRDKNIIVTGAASGIGRLMALRLAEEGARVVVVDVNHLAACAVASEIHAQGGLAWAYALDVADLAAIEVLRRRLSHEIGRISMLINNAGIVHGGEFEKVELGAHLRTYQVNTLGLVALTHAFLDDLLASDEGHLVNIASASGFIGLPYGATYASSKWAVVGFSESIRLELLNRGVKHVRVTTVCPGYINTGMFQGVSAPLVMPMLQPERIVAKILHAVRRNQAFVREPFVVKHIDLLKGLLPLRLYDRLTTWLGVNASMLHWRGRNR